MKRLIATVLTIGVSVATSGSASACCLWPFGGWWGAGYGGGYYSAGYAPYVPPMGYYSAGYAPLDCCAPSCCDPCGAGGCSSGSCAGTEPSGSLKPKSDSNFDKGTGADEDYDSFDRSPLRRRNTDPDPALDPARSQTRRRPVDPDPVDDFGARPMGGADAADPNFGLDPVDEQIKNKPPMDGTGIDIPPADPADPAAPMGAPGAGANDTETFLDLDKKANDSTKAAPTNVLKNVSSAQNEVIAPKRLASRSLPAVRSKSRASIAGSSVEAQSKDKAPLRWISVPIPEGNARL